MRKSWTRDTVIRQILDRESRGLPLTLGGPGVDNSMYCAARRIFGSWPNAIQAAGIVPKTIIRGERWSPAKILVMIRHFARRNRPLTARQMEQRYRNIVSAARRHFGSWGRAVVAAGVDPDKLRRVVPWSPERVIEGILTRALRNESLVARRVEPRSLAEGAERFFGSWQEAVAAAGIDPALASRLGGRSKPANAIVEEQVAQRSKQRNLWNKERVVAAIRLRITECKPIYSRALAREDQRLHSAICRHFGGWGNAMRAAGLDPAVHRKMNPRSKTRVVGAAPRQSDG